MTEKSYKYPKYNYTYTTYLLESSENDDESQSIDCDDTSQSMDDTIVWIEPFVSPINDKAHIIDTVNKIVYYFTPKAACSVTLKCAFDHMGLLEEAMNYDPFVHNYRNEVYSLSEPKDVNVYGYFSIQTIRNPYTRAVSSFYMLSDEKHMRHYTFRSFLRQLIINKKVFSDNILNHSVKQYSKGSEKYIDMFVKIEKSKEYIDEIFNKTGLIIDFGKYDSIHHAKKDNTVMSFCGDTSYKLFYDDKIKKMVEHLYLDDIILGNYSFNDVS
jgi:hypothetical protein